MSETSVGCMCICYALFVRLSGFVRAITCIFVHGFQNNLAQLLSSKSKSAILNICLGRLKIKVSLEGQIIKWSLIELARAITCTFMLGFQK